jgi:hypothetical protein
VNYLNYDLHGIVWALGPSFEVSRAMQTDSNPGRISNAPQASGVARLDWNYPLEMITTALVLLGASAFFRRLPIPDEYAYLLTFIVLFAWRYGVHRAGIIRWRGRGSVSYSFFSLKQALLNGIAFSLLMIAILTFAGSRPTLSSAALAAFGGFVFAVFGVDSKASASSSRPQSANS